MSGSGSSSAFIKKIGSFVPGSALVLFGKWIKLFSAIHMTNPLWERWASTAALGIGTVLSLGAIYLYAEDNQPTLRKYAHRSRNIFLVALVLCYAIYFFLSLVADVDFIAYVIWPVVYIVSMAALCLFLTFLAMYDQKTSRIILIICVIVAVAFVGVIIWLWFAKSDVMWRLLGYS